MGASPSNQGKLIDRTAFAVRSIGKLGLSVKH